MKTDGNIPKVNLTAETPGLKLQGDPLIKSNHNKDIDNKKPTHEIEGHKGYPVTEYTKMEPQGWSPLKYYPQENVPDLTYEQYLLKTDRLFDIVNNKGMVLIDELSSKPCALLSSKDLDIKLANEVFTTHVNNLDKLLNEHNIIELLEKKNTDRTQEEKEILFSYTKSGTFIHEFTGNILEKRKRNDFKCDPSWEVRASALKQKINSKLGLDPEDSSFLIDVTGSG